MPCAKVRPGIFPSFSIAASRRLLQPAYNCGRQKHGKAVCASRFGDSWRTRSTRRRTHESTDIRLKAQPCLYTNPAARALVLLSSRSTRIPRQIARSCSVSRHHAARSTFSMCCAGCLPVWLHRLPPRSDLAPRRAHFQTARHALQLPVRRLRPFAWASPPTPLRNICSLLNCSVDFPCSSLDLSICLQRCPADCRRAAAPPPRHAAPPNRAWQAAPACRLEPQPLPRATTSEPTSRPAQPPTVHVGPL